jgi:DNA repair protein RecO (recombination protein O)
LYCGFYVNELVRNFLHKEDPYPDVFNDYQQCLFELTNNSYLEAALRVFELNLMDNIGYGVDLTYDLHHKKPVSLDKKYMFYKGKGFFEDEDGPFSGLALRAMQQRDFQNPQTLQEAKLLLRTVIDSNLQGKQLKSRAVINSVFKRL